MTDELLADISGGWSTNLGGGLWWRKDNLSKNTPFNMPATILTARLYKKFNDPDDNFLKNNAEKLWSTGTNKSPVLFGSAWNTPPG